MSFSCILDIHCTRINLQISVHSFLSNVDLVLKV